MSTATINDEGLLAGHEAFIGGDVYTVTPCSPSAYMCEHEDCPAYATVERFRYDEDGDRYSALLCDKHAHTQEVSEP